MMDDCAGNRKGENDAYDEQQEYGILFDDVADAEGLLDVSGLEYLVNSPQSRDVPVEPICPARVRDAYSNLLDVCCEYFGLPFSQRAVHVGKYRARCVHGLHVAESRALWLVLRECMPQGRIFELGDEECRQVFLTELGRTPHAWDFAQDRERAIRAMATAGFIEAAQYR